MAVSIDPENGDIIFSGFTEGIGVSPHKGLGNMQNVNLNTAQGEALISFERVQDTMTDTIATGNLSYLSTDHVNLSIPNTNNLFKGNWITVTNSSNTGELPNGTYYVPPSAGAGFQLSKYYNNGFSFTPASLNLLVVGGGGGGGSGQSAQNIGGGGGAGQVLPTTTSISTQTPITVTVGTGGSAVTNGTSSSFGATTVIGGGAGGGVVNPAPGASGASGGGGGDNISANPGSGGTGTAGNNGGSGFSTGTFANMGAGGGGGAGAVGSNGTSGNGGAGGNGVASSITGSSVTYGGGGGGSTSSGGAGAGAGGTGGGGTGGKGAVGTAGTANTGGGGGGGGCLGSGSATFAGGAGGSGIVIISAPIGTILNPGSAGGVNGTHTISGGNDIWTYLVSGTFTPQLPTTNNPAFLTGFTAGLTANFTMVATVGKPIAKTTENYLDNGVTYHRYYILDNNNLVWVYDDLNETVYSPSDGVSWFLPDFHTDWCTVASGIAVISGFLIGTSATGMYSKPTTMLGNTGSTSTTWKQFVDVDGWKGSAQNTSVLHAVFVGAQDTLYVTDSSYIVSVFPDAALADPGLSTAQNVQSFCSWTVDAGDPDFFTGFYTIISGTTPVPDDGKRVPVVFFTPNGGSLPSSITADTVYYLDVNLSVFQVYSASTGGSQLDIQTGSSGTQYFNTFYPYGASATASAGATPTYVLTNPAVALPVTEMAQCLTEIGTTVIIGCRSNILYPWDQNTTQASTKIPLPESNVVQLITVNQMAYVLAGNKGNFYITDGAVASLVTTVPDYCAGVPGSPETYIEPYYTWESTMYLRGRVYFSILDQTATKTGNTGGIWSFIPTQNFYVGQDIGISLRLENQNSYGTYNGAASVLIPKFDQKAISPQYFSGWFSDLNTPTYGIDSTGTFPAGTAIIETELIPTGSILGQQKKTFTSEEYKLSSPLLSGESVQLNYRLDLTSAWKTCGTVNDDDSNMSGYFPINFQNSQWVQFQAVMTPNGTSTFSGNRLTEIRLHPSRYESN